MNNKQGDFEKILKMFDGWTPVQPPSNLNTEAMEIDTSRKDRAGFKIPPLNSFEKILKETRREVESGQLSEGFCNTEDVPYERLAEAAIQKVSSNLLFQFTSSSNYFK